MRGFTYYNPTRVVFGEQWATGLQNALEQEKATSVLLVTTDSLVDILGIRQSLEALAERAGCKLHINEEVVPNPSIDLVRKLILLAREKNVDFLISVGGGSSTDTAKAIAIGVPYEGDVWDFFAGKAEPKSALPIAALATIPASGSETSNAAILSNGPLKRGVETELLYPRVALLNPVFTLGLPAFQTAAGIMDIFSHLLERYFTNDKHVDFTDRLIEGALRSLHDNAYRLLENPKDLDARSEVMWIATVAHNNLLDTGRESCWGSHRIEHELSGEYNLTHGEGMGLVFVAWCRYMADKKPEKLAQLADRLFDLDHWFYTEREAALLLADRIERFAKDMGLRTRLGQFDIDDSRFVQMAERATQGGTVGHYLPLGVDEFVAILNKAF